MMDASAKSKPQTIFKRHIALPQDHGSWVFLLTPLLVGLFAGKSWTLAAVFLILAAFAAFLIRQPVTIAVKIYSHRRNRFDLPAALFWMGVYSLAGLAGLTGLIFFGDSFILSLALPGIPIFIWHLYLVSRRAERRQIGVELVASGVLALAAPAAYWIGTGYPDLTGWWLWALVWFQSAASIVYAYLRLEQRELKEIPAVSQRLRMGRRALLYTSFNLAAVAGLSIARILPPALFLPYLVQWGESIYGTLHPAAGLRPVAIGVRQTVVSGFFTLLFMITWGWR